MLTRKPRLSGSLLLGIFTIVVTVTGCDPSSAETAEPESNDTFIPQPNKKFWYVIENDGEIAGTATQWITERLDSAGIAVFNLHSDIETLDGTLMTMDSRMFSLAGKTYNEVSVPPAWEMSINLLNQMPNISVTKAELFGFPAFLTMDNAIRDGSVLTKTGPKEQGQKVSYTAHEKAYSMEQILTMTSGVSTVETVELPAGSFVCNRFTYTNNQKITIKSKDGSYTGDGEETITLWVAHGVGIVKQESSSRLETLVPLPTGEVHKLVTNSTSRTTLQDIQ